MITAEIILDDRRKTKNGYPIKIRIYDSLEKKLTPHKYLPLKIYQPGPEIKYDSNLKRRFLDLEKEVDYCNNNHLRLNEAYEIIKNGIPIDDVESEIKLLEFKLQQLYDKQNRNDEKCFLAFIDDLIKEREIEGKDIKAYTSIKQILQSLIHPKDDFPINSISKDFLKRLEIQLRERKVKSNSIKTYFRMIKTIFDESKTREELNIKDRDPFYTIKVLDKKKISYSISAEDLIRIRKLKIESIPVRYLKKVTAEIIKRNSEIFLFQFAIGGHDLIDIASLKWESLKDGRLIFKRVKNRNKVDPAEVDVMLCDFALNVIKKYGDKENSRIFSFIPDPSEDYVKYESYLARINAVSYKRIKEVLNLKSEIKTKAPRYIFRTLAGNLLINDFVIMRIQGHKPQGITFGYQGVLDNKVQDKEHQKVLDLVFKEKEKDTE